MRKTRHRALRLALVISALAYMQGDRASLRGQEALSGVYLVEGANDAGVPYRGVVELTAAGSQWHLRYRFEPSGEALGIGLLQGDVLAVIFQTDGGLIGLSVFAIDRSETPMRLRGQWLVPGHDLIMPETLTKTAVRDPALLQGPRTGV